MDVSKFIDTLKPALSRALGHFEIQIKLNRLPTSVEFMVISSEFEEVDRADRINIIADAVEAAFGLPLSFRPMGLGLTPFELKNNPAGDSEDLGHYGIAKENGDGNAAKAY